MGERFRYASFDDYEVLHTAQKAVVASLRGFAAEIVENTKQGRGIVLYGPSGTGKTHLAVACAQTGVAAGANVVAMSAMGFFGRLRDAMGGGESEERIIASYVKPHVLLIDDLLPPRGELTAWQSAQLFRVVDGRYRDCKPTWVTMNCVSGTEAEDRAGVATIDRLRDNALALFANWPSYRKAAT